MNRSSNPGPEAALELARQALAAGRIGVWEIYLSREQTFSVEVKEQKLESLQASTHRGLAVRLLESDRMGFAYGSDLGPAAISELVARARASAGEVSPDPLYSFAGPDPEPLPRLEIYDPDRALRPESEKIERAKELEATALSFDPRLKRVYKAGYQESEQEIFLWTSEGLELDSRSTLFLGSLAAVAEDRGDSQIAEELDFSHFYAKLDIAQIGRRAAARAVGLLGAGPVSSRRCPIVLCPEPASELLGVLAEAASAEALLKKKSWLAEKIGRRVVSQKLSILDDGGLAAAPDCFPFDGEGERSRRTVVVAEGRLNSFLFDRYHARRLGAESTGNSRRESFAVLPQVGVSCFFIQPGRLEDRALVSGLASGLLVEELLGIHLADPVSGEFSVGCVGHLIEKGMTTTPVTGMVLSGQVGELFSRVEALGSDLRFFGEFGSPSLLIGEASLSGR